MRTTEVPDPNSSFPTQSHSNKKHFTGSAIYTYFSLQETLGISVKDKGCKVIREPSMFIQCLVNPPNLLHHHKTFLKIIFRERREYPGCFETILFWGLHEVSDVRFLERTFSYEWFIHGKNCCTFLCTTEASDMTQCLRQIRWIYENVQVSVFLHF